MKNFSLIIQIVSIVAITIPICIGFLKLRTAGLETRLFLLFLLTGLITDVSMFYLLQIRQVTHLLRIFNIYSLIESLFFYWFILRNTASPAFRTAIKTLLIVTPLFWLEFVVMYPTMIFTAASSSQVFDMVYEIAAAFLSGMALLRMVERDENALNSPSFWIMIGIFFYCFCTFFIMGFLNTFLSQKIWVLNNIVNIITYGFYSFGISRS